MNPEPDWTLDIWGMENQHSGFSQRRCKHRKRGHDRWCGNTDSEWLFVTGYLQLVVVMSITFVLTACLLRVTSTSLSHLSNLKVGVSLLVKLGSPLMMLGVATLLVSGSTVHTRTCMLLMLV